VSKCEDRLRCLPGCKGMFYEPPRQEQAKKHPCPDCHFCQQCSPSRCTVCRSGERQSEAKLSLQEQIALYERLNAED
jgi:hypothetical protein